MIKVMKIITDDGQMFDDFKSAKKHVEVEYGRKLTALANKLLAIEKYTPMCEYLDENLREFNLLFQLKKESLEMEPGVDED